MFERESIEIADDEVESDTVNRTKEDRLQVGFGGAHKTGCAGEMFRHS